MLIFPVFLGRISRLRREKRCSRKARRGAERRKHVVSSKPCTYPSCKRERESLKTRVIQTLSFLQAYRFVMAQRRESNRGYKRGEEERDRKRRERERERERSVTLVALVSVNYKVENSNDGQRESFVNRSPIGSQRGICQDGFYPARLSRGSSLAWIELKYGRHDESLRTVCLSRRNTRRPLPRTLRSHIIEIASQISAERRSLSEGKFLFSCPSVTVFDFPENYETRGII